MGFGVGSGVGSGVGTDVGVVATGWLGVVVTVVAAVPPETVTATVADTSGLAALVTVTVQLPSLTPVIRPIPSTVATLTSEETQISLLSGASSGVMVTKGIWVSPTSNVNWYTDKVIPSIPPSD